MPRYIIERELPGAGRLGAEDLQQIAQKSNGVLAEMAPRAQWIQSYVTGDKIYCVYVADDEAAIREHARRGGFPADVVNRISATIDPTTAEGRPSRTGTAGDRSSAGDTQRRSLEMSSLSRASRRRLAGAALGLALTAVPACSATGTTGPPLAGGGGRRWPRRRSDPPDNQPVAKHFLPSSTRRSRWAPTRQPVAGHAPRGQRATSGDAHVPLGRRHRTDTVPGRRRLLATSSHQ